ncbi:MAG: ABC transporter substrate-binding protein [Clostridia bacterium]|nr:ABC transporter substrate-binding protein [Clostridia bacterium]
MKKFTYFAIAFSLLLSVMLVGCSCSPKDNVIRVNEVTHSIFYAPLYVAINKGYMAEENIEIELTNGGGSNVSMTALVSGSADIGLMGPETSVFVATQGKKDLPKVFGQLTKRDGSFLVGRQEMPNFSWSDLEGSEIIAGRRGGMPAMTLEYVLEQNGLYDGQNVTLRYDIEFNNTTTAFQGGTGDYVTAFEPSASALVSTGNAHIVASVGEEAGEVPFTCFMANESYINKNRETVKGFLRAVYKAYKFIMTAPINEVVDALVPSFDTSTKDSIKTCIENYKAIDAWVENPAMTEESYNRLTTIMQNAGELSENVAFSTIVDNTIANEVYAELNAA